jgi:hypothetical protein
MPASNHPDLKFPKGRARALEADADAKDAKAHERKVYAAVDGRDKKRCQCCGRRGNPNATTTLGKLHHEHLRELSLGGTTTPTNVWLACWICQPFKSAHQLDPIGNPEKAPLRFTVTEAAAAVIFKGRHRPAHVRILSED